MPRKKVVHLFPLLHNNVPGDCFKAVGELANQGYGVTLEPRRGRRYFYSAKRKNGRVVKKYLGGGEFGALIAGMVVLKQTEKQEALQLKRNALALLKGEWNDINQALDDFLKQSYLRFSILMEAAGYHRPNRGAWRKKWKRKEAEPMPAQAMLTQATGEIEKTGKPEKRDLWANIPDDKIVTAAWDNPENEILRTRAIAILRDPNVSVGTDGVKDVRAVITRLSGGNAVAEEFRLNQFRTHWREFTGTVHGSPEARRVPMIETILIERIIACRFVLTRAEERRGKMETQAGIVFAEQQIDRAQKRLLSAVKCLAEVKRLGVPQLNVAMPGATQINIGEKQIQMTTPRL